MKSLILVAVSLVMLPSSSLAGKELQNLRQPSEIVISNFAVDNMPALQALVQLARASSVPMGIVQDNTMLTTTPVTISANNSTLAVVLDEIVRQLVGYRWNYSAETSTVLIVPITPRTTTTTFLNMTISRYAPPKIGLRGLEVWLWMYIRAIVNPTQGTAGNILQSQDERTFQLDERDATVEQILNKIVAVSNGTWVLSPLPSDLKGLQNEPPFSVRLNSE